jgi:AcrR family transcriptional regulator
VPKETFLNLPEAKRRAIVEAAVDEFAAYSYEQASVNRIVASAGIAKGSFYQYFEDKKDLYLYLMSLIAEEKVNYLSPVINNPAEHDIFTVIREMYLSGAQFAVERPRYTAIANRLMADREAPIFQELQVDSRPASFALFQPLIEQAIARGEIRADIDTKMLNYIVASINLSLVEYCSEIAPDNLTETVVETVDIFMDFLKNGIGAQAAS